MRVGRLRAAHGAANQNVREPEPEPEPEPQLEPEPPAPPEPEPEPPEPELDPEWIEHYDPRRERSYYYNPTTKKTLWRLPAGASSRLPSSDEDDDDEQQQADGSADELKQEEKEEEEDPRFSGFGAGFGGGDPRPDVEAMLPDVLSPLEQEVHNAAVARLVELGPLHYVYKLATTSPAKLINTLACCCGQGTGKRRARRRWQSLAATCALLRGCWSSPSQNQRRQKPQPRRRRPRRLRRMRRPEPRPRHGRRHERRS